jgi:hypothetical protein
MTPFVLTVLAGIGCVMSDAEGACVDLRRPRRDNFPQQRLQTIASKRLSESIWGCVAAGLMVKRFSLGAIVFPFWWSSKR